MKYENLETKKQLDNLIDEIKSFIPRKVDSYEICQKLEAIRDSLIKEFVLNTVVKSLPNIEERNLVKNEYADDIQKTLHTNLCKPSYKLGFVHSYEWIKQETRN